MSKALVLRTCKPDMTSHGGFLWPKSGVVEAPDWSPEPTCGHGLHGLLWGEGNGSLLDWTPDAKWLVVEVDAGEVIDLRGKVKFPRCKVVFCGDRHSATAYLEANGGKSKAVVGITATAGDYGTATAGYRGTATAGDYGTATAGYRGTATAGDRGTATAGDCGTATAGDRGAATAGDYGTATAGYRGTATAGDRGTIVIKTWDMKAGRYRLVVGYPGERELLANVAYRLDDNGAFVPAEAVTAGGGE